LEEVRKMADKVFFLFQGKVFFEGSTEDLVLKFLGIRVIIETQDGEALLSLLKKLDYVKNIEFESNKFFVELTEDSREELLREIVMRGIRVKSFYLNQDLEKAYEMAIREARAK
ncbi:MAG: ABC transporter ATP-binding protein, partial [Metallosphaera sp.]